MKIRMALVGIVLGAVVAGGAIAPAAARQNYTNEPTSYWCPPLYYLANGQCVPHGLNKPGVPRDGGYDGGMPGRDPIACEWETGGYFICPGNGKTNPRPK